MIRSKERELINLGTVMYMSGIGCRIKCREKEGSKRMMERFVRGSSRIIVLFEIMTF